MYFDNLKSKLSPVELASVNEVVELRIAKVKAKTHLGAYRVKKVNKPSYCKQSYYPHVDVDFNKGYGYVSFPITSKVKSKSLDPMLRLAEDMAVYVGRGFSIPCFVPVLDDVVELHSNPIVNVCTDLEIASKAKVLIAYLGNGRDVSPGAMAELIAAKENGAIIVGVITTMWNIYSSSTFVKTLCDRLITVSAVIRHERQI